MRACPGIDRCSRVALLLASAASIVGTESDVHRSAAVRPAGGSVFLSAPRDITLTCPTPRPLSDTEGSEAPTGGETMEQTMRVKMPIDPTMPNPQDPKDAPHSHNSGGSGFMPYVPPWERLSDAAQTRHGGRALEGGGANRYLPSHRRSSRQNPVQTEKAHNSALRLRKRYFEGTDFEIPTKIKPQDLDWERSRPLKPWVVRRGRLFTTGILGPGVDRALQGRRYESFVHCQGARQAHPTCLK